MTHTLSIFSVGYQPAGNTRAEVVYDEVTAETAAEAARLVMNRHAGAIIRSSQKCN